MNLNSDLTHKVFNVTMATKWKKKRPTSLPLTGGGIIVCALNLLFLEVGLEPRQVCVQTSDVFVNLRRQHFSRPSSTELHYSQHTLVKLVFQNRSIKEWGTNHFVRLHGQLHLIISKLFTFTVGLLNLPQYWQLLFGGKSASVGRVFFSQRVDLSFQI